MEHALSHGAPTPNEVALWVHFGASLAATKLDPQYRFKTPQYLVGLPTTESWAKSALSQHMPLYVKGNSATLGEAGQVIGAGHQRFVGLSGKTYIAVLLEKHTLAQSAQAQPLRPQNGS